jgi:general secretion pathway protein A
LKQHAAGRRVVLVVDEAQNLSPEALEQVRLLTNLETAKEKLLQIILLGQPELRDVLKRKSLRQLAQRITARYHLAPLSRDETAAYVRHRINVAGAATNPFSRSALRALYQRSEGIPRLINIIADRALVGAYAEEATSVGARLVHAAADEVQPSESRMHSGRWPGIIAATSALVLLVVTLGLYGVPQWGSREEPAVPVSASHNDTGPESPSATRPADERVDGPDTVDGTGSAVAVESRSEPETRVPALPDELDPEWLEHQHERAWQAMAELWLDRDAAGAIEAACAGDPGRGYSCLRESGNWSRVRQLGLPVLLVLQGDEPRFLLLRGLTGRGLLVGDELSSVEVSRAAVEDRWLGEFVLPWPQARNWPAEVRKGEEGPAVDIVLEMATFAEPPWTGGDEFDDQFESWLVSFQRRNGLKADGIVGRVTLLYLLAPTISQPRLITPPEENS